MKSSSSSSSSVTNERGPAGVAFDWPGAIARISDQDGVDVSAERARMPIRGWGKRGSGLVFLYSFPVTLAGSSVVVRERALRYQVTARLGCCCLELCDSVLLESTYIHTYIFSIFATLLSLEARGSTESPLANFPREFLSRGYPRVCLVADRKGRGSSRQFRIFPSEVS